MKDAPDDSGHRFMEAVSNRARPEDPLTKGDSFGFLDPLKAGGADLGFYFLEETSQYRLCQKISRRPVGPLAVRSRYYEAAGQQPRWYVDPGVLERCPTLPPDHINSTLTPLRSSIFPAGPFL